MADIKYILELDTAGAQGNLQRLRSSIRQTNSAFEGLRGLLAGVAAAVSVREVIALSDTITNLRNRLITISPTLQDVENQFNAIAAIALGSRAPLEAVGDLYFRIARASGELGLSQKEAADITDTLSKAMTTTGLSAQEAAGPLLQIGQALQSGRFQGDELRSVLEGMPVVSQALAEELGVTIGELRKLGSEGKITGDVFVRAMKRAKEGVDEAFARTLPTITQAFTNFRTALTLAFGEFEKNTQAGKSTAAAIEVLTLALLELGDNIDAVVQPIKILLQIIGAVASISLFGRAWRGLTSIIGAVGTATKGITESFKFLFGLMKDSGAIIRQVTIGKLKLGEVLTWILTPVTFLIEKFGALAAGIGAFLGIDAIFKWFEELGNSQEAAADRSKRLNERLEQLREGLKDVQGENRAAAAQQAQLNKLISQGSEELQRAARAYQETADQQARALRDQIEAIGLTEEQIKIKESQRDAETAYLSEAKRLQDELFRVKKSDKEEDKAQIPIILRLLAELDNRYKSNLETNTKLTEELNNRLSIQKQLAEFDKMDDALKAQNKSIENSQQQLALETAKLRLSERERDAIDLRYSLEQARLSAIEPLQQRLLELKRSNSESDKALIPIIEEQIAKVNQLYATAVPAQIELLNAKERELEITKLINFTEETRKDTAEKIRDIQRETAKLTMSEIEKKYYDIANAAEDSARRAIQAEEKRRGVKLPIEEQRKYYDEAKKQAEELTQAQAKHQQQARSWETGWTKAYKNYVDEATNAAKAAESVFAKATKGMEDAMVNFAKTGKFEFKSFMNSILEELLRSQVRNLMAQVFNIGSQAGGGSLFGSIGKLLGFANGGIIPTNNPVLVGERGPELISGASGRVVTPNNQLGLGSQMVTYNINAVDAASFKQLVARDPAFIHAVAMQGGKSTPMRR